jgi:hypothetical protein
MRYFWIDNKRYEWKEILRQRRQQVEAERRAQQPMLFELRDDSRPASQQTTRGRGYPAFSTFAPRTCHVPSGYWAAPVLVFRLGKNDAAIKRQGVELER